MALEVWAMLDTDISVQDQLSIILSIFFVPKLFKYYVLVFIVYCLFFFFYFAISMLKLFELRQIWFCFVCIKMMVVYLINHVHDTILVFYLLLKYSMYDTHLFNGSLRDTQTYKQEKNYINFATINTRKNTLVTVDQE